MATIALSNIYGSKLAYDTGIWGEFYRLFCWKIPSLVGVLVCVKGGVWQWMCVRQALGLIEEWPLWITGWWVRRRVVIG